MAALDWKQLLSEWSRQGSDWLNQQLRIRLLPHNPYFKKEVIEARHALGIPDGGFANRQKALVWVWGHLKKHGPYRRPRTANAESERVWAENMADLMLSREIRSSSRPRLPIAEQAHSLQREFGLPACSVEPLVWHILTGREIPLPFPVLVDEVGPPCSDDPSEYAMEPAVYDFASAGLEGISGDLVVVRMVVNEYTTKREFEKAWDSIEEIRARHLEGKRVPRRRRSGDKVEKQSQRWVAWYRSHKECGKTLNQIADEAKRDQKENYTIEAIRYAIRETDKLMRPKSKKS